MPTLAIPGRLAWLELSLEGRAYIPFGGIVDVSLDTNTDALDVTTRDDGRQRRYIPNHSDSSMDLTARWEGRDPGQKLVRLAEHHGGTFFFTLGMQRADGSTVYTGRCFVRRTKSSGPLDAPASFEVTLRISGPIGVDHFNAGGAGGFLPTPVPPVPVNPGIPFADSFSIGEDWSGPPPGASLAESFEHDEDWDREIPLPTTLWDPANLNTIAHTVPDTGSDGTRTLSAIGVTLATHSTMGAVLQRSVASSMTGPPGVFTTATDFSWAIAFELADPQPGAYTGLFTKDSPGADYTALRQNGPNQLQFYSSPGGSNLGALATATPYVLGGSYTTADNITKLYLNGAFVANASGSLSNGNTLFVGEDNPAFGTRQLAGQIARVPIYAGVALTGAQQAALATRLLTNAAL